MQQIKINDINVRHVGETISIIGKVNKTKPIVIPGTLFTCLKCNNYYKIWRKRNHVSREPYFCKCGNKKFSARKGERFDYYLAQIEELPKNIVRRIEVQRRAVNIYIGEEVRSKLTENIMDKDIVEIKGQVIDEYPKVGGSFLTIGQFAIDVQEISKIN